MVCRGVPGSLTRAPLLALRRRVAGPDDVAYHRRVVTPSRNARPLLLALVASCGSCGSGSLRVFGSEPASARPPLTELSLPQHEYRAWVMVPRVRVNVYPRAAKTQQPLIQFTGDAQRFAAGTGQLAVLVAPDRYRDGDEVRFFADKVLWTERLEERDRRSFTLWLRENNRSAPTRHDLERQRFTAVVGAIEEIVGLSGLKIPARRALDIGAENLKRLAEDWLILRWTCPWTHVLRAAEARISPQRRSVMLRARLVSSERVEGKPVAELDVLFAVEKLQHSPLPAATAE